MALLPSGPACCIATSRGPLYLQIAYCCTAPQVELSRLGLPLSGGHALFAHLYLANMGHFSAANTVYCKFFPAVDPPSRACVQVWRGGAGGRKDKREKGGKVLFRWCAASP